MKTRLAIATMAWIAIGALFALPSVLRGEGVGGGADIVIATMMNWWLWGAFTPLIAAVDRRLSAAGWSLAPFLAAHVVAAIALPALYVGVAASLEYQLGLNKWNPWALPSGLIDWWLWALFVYGLIIGTLQAVKYYRRQLSDTIALERLERRLLETRLDALRFQLDPQFLFDVLAGISARVEHEPRVARRMIEHLGDLLRFSLATRDRTQLSVTEEMSFLDNYLALHRLRLNNRLTVTLSVAPEVEQARIPSQLFQPLVENAVRHGIAARAGGGSIEVAARLVGASVEIRVSDDGAGLPPGWRIDNAAGQGLSVTRERLLAMYPAGACDFAVGPRAEGGTEARISLPLSITNEERHDHAIA
ncbi:MAG: histidine kinase [Massilia sp.]